MGKIKEEVECFEVETTSEGDYVVSASCDNFESKKDGNTKVFYTLRLALNYCHEKKVESVKYYDYVNPYGINLKV
jgi:hypothetical protein